MFLGFPNLRDLANQEASCFFQDLLLTLPQWPALIDLDEGLNDSSQIGRRSAEQPLKINVVTLLPLDRRLGPKC
jgi:hypothetical protein